MSLIEAIRLFPNPTGNTTLRSVYHYVNDVRRFDSHTNPALDAIVKFLDNADDEITLGEISAEFGGYQP